MEKENTISPSTQEQRHARNLKTLKETMLQLAMSRHPFLSHSQQEILEKQINVRLPSLLPSQLRTPNHPPYALMIHTAIEGLKKKKGSSKASISSFIKSNYQHLPLAHEHLLAHHLERLAQVGEIVYVKSLYKLPVDNNTNSEKQQQEEEQQLIVLGGGMVGREMGNNDVNGGRFVTIHEKHCSTVAERIEPVDDDVGEGWKASAAVTELKDLFQKKTLGRGRGRHPKKRSKVEQQHMEVANTIETIPSRPVAAAVDNLAVVHHSLEQARDCSQEVAMLADDVGLMTLCEKHQTSGIQVVKPLDPGCRHGKLSGRGRGRAPNKEIEAEQQQEKVEKISETSMSAAVVGDNNPASEFQISLSQEQLSGLQSRPLEEELEDKQEEQVLPAQDEEESLVSVRNESLTAVTVAVPEGRDCHPSSSTLEQEHQQQQLQVISGGDLLSTTGDDDFVSEEQQQRLQGRHLEKEHEDKREEEQELAMKNEEGSLVSVLKEPSMTTVTVVVQEDRECHPFSSNLDHERQKQQGFGQGDLPSVETALPANDLLSEIEISGSQEQQQRLQSRPLEKKHGDKQQDELEIAMEEPSMTIATVAVKEDREWHPFSSNHEQEHQQNPERIVGGDLLSVAVADDDVLVSELDRSQSQGQQQTHKSRLLEKEHEDKQRQPEELTMEDEEVSLLSVMREPSTVIVTMAVKGDRGCHPFSDDLEQEHQQQQQGISGRDLTSMATDDNDLVSEFKIFQSQRQQQKLQSRLLENESEDKQQQEQGFTMEYEEASVISASKVTSTMTVGVKEDGECHLFSANLGQEHQQQHRQEIIGGDFPLMADDDEDLVSEFVKFQPQEERQRLECRPLEKENEHKQQQEQELAMEWEEVPLFSVTKEPSMTTVTMAVKEDGECHPFSSDLEQEYQQRQQRINRGEPSLIVSDEDNLLSEFWISQPQERQQRLQSQPIEMENEDMQQEEQEQTKENEGSLISAIKESSMTTVTVAALNERKGPRTRSSSKVKRKQQQELQQQQQQQEQGTSGGDLSSMAAADDLVSEFEISQFQEQHQRLQIKPLEKGYVDKQQQELPMEYEEGSFLSVNKTPSTTILKVAVKEDKECHPFSSDLEQDHQQKQQGIIGDLPSMVDDDDDFVSEFEKSQPQEEQRKLESRPLEQENERKQQQQQELAMEYEEFPLFSFTQEASMTIVTVAVKEDEECHRDLEQEHQQQQQQISGGDLPSMVSDEDDLVFEFKISRPQEQQRRLQSRPLETENEDIQHEEQEQTKENEGSLVSFIKESSTTTVTVAVLNERKGPRTRSSSKLERKHQQKQQGNSGGDLSSMAAADEHLVSELEISQFQEQKQRLQNKPLEKENVDKQQEELDMEYEEASLLSVNKEPSTTIMKVAVKEDKECHPFSSDVEQDHQQQQQGIIGRDLPEMVDEDDDLVSEFEKSQPQEKPQRLQSRPLEKENEHNQHEEQELAMECEVSLFSVTVEPSATIVTVAVKEDGECHRDLEQEQRQQRQRISGGDLPSMVSDADDLVSEFKIPQPQERQQRLRSRPLEKDNEDIQQEEEEQAMENQGSVVSVIKKSSTTTITRSVMAERKGPRTRSSTSLGPRTRSSTKLQRKRQ